jgi:SAM-dependent methyltransferase
MNNEDNKKAEYTGTDNLEVMAEAINYNQFLVDLILKHAKKGESILDFGAGIGTFAKIISEHGHTVSCIEPDSNQASVITDLGLTAYNDLDQVETNTLDYVYTLNVLEHIEDDRAMLESIYQRIRPGGRLMIYVPAFQVLYSSMDEKVGHHRRYTRESLEAAVKSAGFKVESSRYADSLGFFATLAYKLIGDSSGDVNVRALITYDRLIFPVSRILDKLLGLFLGKNVLLVAVK